MEQFTRFRFRFSLRGLMITVTIVSVVGGCLASQYRIVRLRKATVARIDEAGGGRRYESDDTIDRYPQTTLPWIRRILGDRAITEIFLPLHIDPANRRRIEEAFPEAKVLAIRPPFNVRKLHKGNADEYYSNFSPFPDEEKK